MRVLITGGAGFIGSHVADRALERGYEVAVLDNLASGRQENVPDKATFYEVDVCDVDSLNAAFADFRPTHVNHQAAQASVAVSVRNPLMDASVNILGSLNVLTASVAHQVERIVFASTGGAIYGEVPESTRADTDTVPVPISPYACSKFAVEKYLECFRIEHGLTYNVLRYANVYGPRQDPHGEAGVVAIFCNRIMAGKGIQLNAMCISGDDGCIRDYVYVKDVVEANIASMENRIPDPVLNIGTGTETTTRQLACSLQEHLGKSVNVTPSGHRAGDIQRSVLNGDRLTELLGKSVPLDQGLGETANWFKQRST
ncbi:MAG: SDR family NAD(P)-dependent oxidoreductase [Fuerstiella sp.]|nr:SDR family NAD(P)-dependent oxidoreductase [Fuerstiella sp.]